MLATMYWGCGVVWSVRCYFYPPEVMFASGTMDMG